MEKKKDNLIISQGKLSEEDKSWDIKFWQSVSSFERFKAAADMIRAAYKHKTGKEPPKKIDKTYIITGTYANYNDS